MQVGHCQLAAVGVHTCIDSCHAHAVADQQDDVADFGVGAVDFETGDIIALVGNSGFAYVGSVFSFFCLGENGGYSSQQCKYAKNLFHL